MPAAPVPDAQRLQAQLADLAETSEPSDDGSPVRLLRHLRAVLAARTVALLPVGADEPVFAGVEAADLVRLPEVLDRHKAQMLPAPALGANGYTLSVPVWREGQLHGWLVAQLEVAHPRDVQAFVVLLQTFAGYLLYRAQRGAIDELRQVVESASGLLDVFRHAGRELDFDLACRVAVDALGVHLGCSRVSLGLRRGRALRVIAISGAGKVDSKSPSLHPLEAAMREAVRSGEPVEWTPASPRSDTTLAHEILREQTEAARILTLPLPRERGALLCEWDQSADLAIAPAVDAAAPFVPVLFDLLDRARPNPVIFTARRWWWRAGGSRRRTVLLGVVAFAALLAWPFHYRIGADCRVVPSVKQVVAAPFDGQLRKSLVRPGDVVREGDLLGELDNRELKLKEAELIASRDRALKQRDRAIAGGDKREGADFAAAQMAGFEAQSVGQELQLVRRKLALLEVKAPLAGVVVSGDLRRAQGQPVPRGQVLWEVAPLETMTVEIDVPDREIGRIRVGLPVQIRLEAFGGGTWETVVRRIYAQSEQREGKNVFVAEAEIAADQMNEFRPGMRGRVSIQAERRPLLWILGHRFWDWLVTTLFW